MTRSLSRSSSLDLFKQDAKRWLGKLRRDDPAAHARLKAAWPAAPTAPTLRDVQHALAREYGLADWQALLAALDDLALDREAHSDRVAAVLRHGWDGDVARARRIVARFPDVRTDSLFAAAACGAVDEVRRRIAQRPQLAKDTDPVRGWTALTHVAYGRLDSQHAVTIARVLLEAGADPNAAFDDGWGNPFTPITGAIGLGEGAKPPHAQAAALVALFLEFGADPFDTQALYNSSIVHDDISWTALLWEHSAQQERTALWRQTEGRQLGGKHKVGTLSYLLGNAVSNNHLRRAQWLLEQGADARAIHSYSGRLLHTEARLLGRQQMVTLLEQHGAVVEALSGEAALIAAALAGDEPTVRALAAASGLATRPGPLFAAAAAGSATAVAMLLDLGAPVNAVDMDGATPLHRAVQAGAVAVIDCLLAAGAEVDIRERKWQGTPMSWAVVLGQHRAAERLALVTRDVRALVRSNRLARLDAVLQQEPERVNQVMAGQQDPTALFCLPDDEQHAVDLTRLMLSYGADVSIRDSRGWTAAEAALARGLDAAAMLMDPPIGADA